MFRSTVRTSTAVSVAERRRLLDPDGWEWLVPPVYDVSPEAREAAKLSYSAALTDPLPVTERTGR